MANAKADQEILAIALGRYTEKPELASFLAGLARSNRGGFLGISG